MVNLYVSEHTKLKFYITLKTELVSENQRKNRQIELQGIPAELYYCN